MKSKYLGAVTVVIAMVIAGGVGYYLGFQEGRKQSTAKVNEQTEQTQVNLTAWDGMASEERPTHPLEEYMSLSFTSADYDAISASDNKLKYTNTSTEASREDYPYHLFRFKMISKTIKNVSVTWEGVVQHPSCPRSVAIYLWDKTLFNWTEIGGYNNMTEEQIITCPLANASVFICDDDFIFILVYCRTSGTGRSYSSLGTDYIEMKNV